MISKLIKNLTNWKNGFNLWDLLGFFLSGVCLIHCLAIPLIMLWSPQFLAQWIPTEDLTHVVLMTFILGVAGVAFVRGYNIHGEMAPPLWMAGGILLVGYATYWAHDHLGHFWEPGLVIVGSLMLIRAHQLNHYHCRLCVKHHEEHDHNHKSQCDGH